MLEVKQLSKIYKTGKGVEVKALDEVSLRFPKTGMVFLLGKSGSGKSTLLNVCGGLDAPTSGEVIVKGRSSKDFSQSDFDSYRNTYVGFIFQEYNILNEFSVEDNIALALELQGKSKDKKAVAQLLSQVDLEGYAKRKPNTLSGGQKQRIAIARALVKSPEIIMADEPTGALDSNTGKQVFETLKKLSQDKLVIVVSHDREFAEQYGDRIIELQDGKILSDISKTQEQQKAISENVNVVGDVICIQNGADLSEQEFDVIKDFLRKSANNVVIANNEKDVDAIKKVTRITDDGQREVFRDTEEDKIDRQTYKPEDSKFIRSKLPARHAIRIGLSSLKSKPIRLFFTILLCTVAFTLFGLLSTMSFYNSEATFKQTMLDSEHNLLRIKKNYQGKDIAYHKGEKEYEYETVLEGRFSQAEMEELKSQFGADVFGGVPVYFEYNTRSTPAPYWMNSVSAIAYIGEEHALRSTINGSYPATKDEICISTYAADVIINCKAYDDNGNVIDVSTREELFGKKIQMNGTAYQIVGIFDSGVISDKYEELKSKENENNQLTYELQTKLNDGLHFVAFVNQERLEKIASENRPYTGEDLTWYRKIATTVKNADGKYEFPEWGNMIYDNLVGLGDRGTLVYTDGEKNSLADDEAVITHRYLAEVVMNAYSEKANAASEREEWTKVETFNKTTELCSQIMSGGIWKHNASTKKDELIAFTEAELAQKVKELLNAMKKDGVSISLGSKLFSDESQSVYGDLKEFKIAGIHVLAEEGVEQKMYVSDNQVEAWWNEQKLNVDYYYVTETNYKDDADAVYGNLFLPYDHSEEQTQTFWEMYNKKGYDEDGSTVKPTGAYIEKLTMIDELVKSLSQVFLYVGLVLAVFAALLLSNFISVSISQKKKEIGILRAVGARSLDVFKIFFSESFFIALLCVIFASFSSAIVCRILNTELAAEFGASLFVFGIASLVVLIAIAFVTTVVATFLPVWNAAKKKPVESIRAL